MALSEKWCLVSDKRWEPYKLWSDDVLLVTSRDGDMGALDPVAGELRWSRGTPEELAVRWRDTVLIKDGPLNLLDAMTGNVNRPDGRLRGVYRHKTSLCGVSVVDGRLLVTTGDGQLLAFALDDVW